MRKFVLSLLSLLFMAGVAVAQTCPTPAQLASDLNNASQGDVLSLSGVNPLSCPQVSMAGTWTGGKLVFSDSPESPSQKGRLYEDTFAATAGTTYNRLFINHANGKSSGKLKLAVLIKNTGTSAGTLTIQKKGLAGPSLSYVTVGKLAFQRWEQSTAGSPTSISAGSTVRLDSANLEQNENPGYLINGIYDISMTQPYKVTVCALDQNDNPLTVCPGLAILPRDVHDRGTFPYADKIYDTAPGVSVNTVDGVQQFVTMDDNVDDAAVGTDATDGSAATLHGNIGVLYRMHLLLASGDGADMGILINPRGGYWGTALYTMAGVTPGGVFLCPAATEGLSDNTKACVEGKYAPGGGLTAWVQAMMTSGSNAPLRWILAPH